MGQNRNMPSKKNITKHWRKTYDIDVDETHCWGCGFNYMLDRAHLVARKDKSYDIEDNLVLLCRHCHITQEPFTQNAKTISRFKQLILEGNPFFDNAWHRITNNIRLGLYDNSIEQTSILKSDLNKWKNFLNKK